MELPGTVFFYFAHFTDFPKMGETPAEPKEYVNEDVIESISANHSKPLVITQSNALLYTFPFTVFCCVDVCIVERIELVHIVI